MASAGQRPATLAGATPTPRFVVTLGSTTRGGKAYRVESPDRVLRLWAMLNEAGSELHAQTLPPRSLARVHRMLMAA